MHVRHVGSRSPRHRQRGNGERTCKENTPTLTGSTSAGLGGNEALQLASDVRKQRSHGSYAVHCTALGAGELAKQKSVHKGYAPDFPNPRKNRGGRNVSLVTFCHRFCLNSLCDNLSLKFAGETPPGRQQLLLQIFRQHRCTATFCSQSNFRK